MIALTDPEVVAIVFLYCVVTFGGEEEEDADGEVVKALTNGTFIFAFAFDADVESAPLVGDVGDRKLDA